MNHFTIYTDGSCKGNGTKATIGGWAYIILDEEENLYAYDSKGLPNTTNNRMELTAIIEALKYIHMNNIEPIICDIYTDSAYIHNCYAKKWYKNWQRNGWINSSKVPVKNKDLWKKLIPFFDNPNFHFNKVKGHSHNENIHQKWNNIVDKMAVKATKEM